MSGSDGIARTGRPTTTMRRQLHRLYGASHDINALWARIETVLRDRLAARPAVMRELDAARVADPDWFIAPDMIGYSTYVDGFAGTVKGVMAHVDHLDAMGVRYLHLLAPLKARAGDSDGGFAVADYLSVEPALGTMADVERLCERLRASRISLCVDLAINHTADDHVWALAARAGDPYYRNFYLVLDGADAARREALLPQVFPTTAPGNFTVVPDMGGAVWTTFYPFQWDLNWANSDVMGSDDRYDAGSRQSWGRGVPARFHRLPVEADRHRLPQSSPRTLHRSRAAWRA